MISVRLPRIGTESAWRETARRLRAASVAPGDVDWGIVGAPDSLFSAPVPDAPAQIFTVPRHFHDLLPDLVPERSGRGLGLAYSLFVRTGTERGLLSNRADPDVSAAEKIAKEVRRDKHKMRAFLRFREREGSGGRRSFAAWFQPDHRIEEVNAPFFQRRFGDMDWLIATPEVTVACHRGTLRMVAEPNLRPDDSDALEALWTTYFSNIFNPARLKVKAMTAEMPKKYWKNLPEARAIPGLIEGATRRAEGMRAAAPTLPPARAERITERLAETLADIRAAYPAGGGAAQAADLDGCRRCGLWRNATQAVPGEGPPGARLMIVGEQPGDREDLAGRPFVGPAGQLFDRIAGEAGLDRAEAYVTNAVKHFKFTPRGKRRIHQRPDAGEVERCRWWLDREKAQVEPDVILALGATALASLTGSGAGILKRRGGWEADREGRRVFVTVHPSYLLRLPDDAARAREEAAFRDDLRIVAEALRAG